MPLQAHFTLVETANHQTDKSSQRSRELKILRQRFRFMLCPHPPGVSSKPFSRPQKVPRLNVTLADRCTRKKVDRGGFFLRGKGARAGSSWPSLEFVRENKQWVTPHWEVLPDKRTWLVLARGGNCNLVESKNSFVAALQQDWLQ